MVTWRHVREVHPEISLIGLYALQGAVLNIHWNALSADMKDDVPATVEDGLRIKVLVGEARRVC